MPPGQLCLAEDLAALIRGEHNFTVFHGGKPEETSFHVKEVEVVPQPLGTYWSQVLDVDGEVNSSLEGRVGIVDIGFLTTDLAAIEDGEFIPEKSRTVPVGVSSAYRDIENRLVAEYGVERESYSLDEAVIRKQINVAGRAIDISKLMDEPFEQLAAKIVVEIVSSWSVPEFDTVLLGGGGSGALGRYLLAQIPQGKPVIDPVTANSRGFLAWANRLWRTGPREQD